MVAVNTMQVAEWVATLEAQDLPEPCRARARDIVRDTVATALGGSQTRAVSVAARATAGESGPFRAVLPGAPLLPASSAGFLSGLAASALDYDDGHYLGGAIHPASCLVAGLLVSSSVHPVSWEDLELALVAAYEVSVRMAHRLWAGAGERWHCTGTAATVGLAAGVAKLWDGDVSEVFRAMQAAWNHAPFASLELPMGKEAIGWGTGAGVTAALLARQGWMTTIFGEPDPVASSIFPVTPFDEADASEQPFVTSLGSVFEIENNYFKPYAACRYTHTAVDELLAVLREGVVPAEVRSVEVSTHSWATFLDRPRPASLEHAQYSYQFVLGSVLARGGAGPREIAEERLRDPSVLACANRIGVRHDAALDSFLPSSYPTRLTVTLTSGRVLEREARLVATGDPASPMTRERLREKAVELIGIAAPGASDAVLECLSGEQGTSGLWAVLVNLPAGR
jgi:2-methylcitrate dehydratase PrpD